MQERFQDVDKELIRRFSDERKLSFRVAPWQSGKERSKSRLSRKGRGNSRNVKMRRKVSDERPCAFNELLVERHNGVR